MGSVTQCEGLSLCAAITRRTFRCLILVPAKVGLSCFAAIWLATADGGGVDVIKRWARFIEWWL